MRTTASSLCSSACRTGNLACPDRRDRLRTGGIACPTTSAMNPNEIDEPSLHVGAHQLHAHAMPDVESFRAVHELPFHRRMKDAHPRPFLAFAGDDGVELLADARRQQARRG